MLIALCQINNTVGDLEGNAKLIAQFARRAAALGADLAVFPELALTGYPPRDLVEKPSFVERSEAALARLAESLADLSLGVITGYAGRAPAGSVRRAANSAALLAGGEVRFVQSKMLLPTYDVFDESRNFEPATRQSLCEFQGVALAITICEDAWNDKQFWDRPRYEKDPVEDLIAQGASLVISINGSPYHMGKRALRRQMFAAMAGRHRVPHVYVNMTGGNDQLVFDGSSFAALPDGAIPAEAPSFAEDLILFNTETGAGDRRPSHEDETSAVYDALVLGARDYMRKCGFGKALLGLSGGVDSTLVACIAVDAVGSANVTGVAMPGPYSTDHSLEDARVLAKNLGIRIETAPITEAYNSLTGSLGGLFAGAPADTTEENIQSRLRGLTLMALSNKWNALVLTTGNKSELAVGYCTLYGDMCGGLAVISDVPKTLVYGLCRVVNRRRAGTIPERVFTKAPSAELRPGQKDTDSLPEYGILDAILKAYVEEMAPPVRIAESLNVPLALVRDIATKVDRNEYKRQQAAPGLKVTTKAFGIGRRFPIAQRFTE